MTEPACLNELAERGVLRRVEMVRARMRHWGLGAGDPGHIDVDDPANLDRAHPRCMSGQTIPGRPPVTPASATYTARRRARRSTGP
jgi:hypothetical protein